MLVLSLEHKHKLLININAEKYRNYSSNHTFSFTLLRRGWKIYEANKSMIRNRDRETERKRAKVKNELKIYCIVQICIMYLLSFEEPALYRD